MLRAGVSFADVRAYEESKASGCDVEDIEKIMKL